MPDFLEDKKSEIKVRLKELRPLVDEFNRLEAAMNALDGVAGSTAPRQAPTRRRRRKSSSAGTGTAKRGRPKGSGTRAKQALKVVTANPGITIPELAEKMKIKQNYLYRVLPGLESDGMVRKEGRGWHAKDAA